jgi:hypothetical protein
VWEVDVNLAECGKCKCPEITCAAGLELVNTPANPCGECKCPENQQDFADKGYAEKKCATSAIQTVITFTELECQQSCRENADCAGVFFKSGNNRPDKDGQCTLYEACPEALMVDAAYLGTTFVFGEQ